MRKQRHSTAAWLAALVVTLLAPLASAQGLFGGSVPTITLEEIREAEEKGEPLQFVDVRSEEEMAVSMLPGAITRREYERNPGTYEDARIVPYCTVGARSGKYTRELRERGITAVNYRGSIIDWVEHGEPLVTPDGEPTKRVHTYSDRFSVPEPYIAVTE
ncbi:MAG TPA: rhodanese-like domain-containing protein [Halieaceae bacterium]|nr:rhodanese-like domain-containing protein [Halieaceae bacterium]